jgi:integrase/recombinase XerC
LESPKKEKRLPHIASQQVLLPALDALNEQAPITTDYAAIRNQLMLELLYGCGLRRAELLKLSLRDFDRKQQTIRVTGKGNKMRIVPYGSPVQQCLQAYLHQCQTEGRNLSMYFWQTDSGKPAYEKLVYNLVRQFMASLPEGTGRQSPHVLRHTFATHLLENGADLNAVKELMGHASLASTQVYLHSSAQRLKKVFEQAHPKAQIE